MASAGRAAKPVALICVAYIRELSIFVKHARENLTQGLQVKTKSVHFRSMKAKIQ